jgi:hypothetical protein
MGEAEWQVWQLVAKTCDTPHGSTAVAGFTAPSGVGKLEGTPVPTLGLPGMADPGFVPVVVAVPVGSKPPGAVAAGAAAPAAGMVPGAVDVGVDSAPGADPHAANKQNQSAEAEPVTARPKMRRS